MEPAGDVADRPGGDLTGARGEDEPDGVGAEAERQHGVVLVGDPADLDEQSVVAEHSDESTDADGRREGPGGRRRPRRDPRR